MGYSESELNLAEIFEQWLRADVVGREGLGDDEDCMVEMAAIISLISL